MSKEEQIFYGKTTGLIADTDVKSIQNLYQKCRIDGTIKDIIMHGKNQELYYGLYEEIYEERKYIGKGKYYILGNTPREDFVKITIPKATWACFSLPNKKQKEILKLEHEIYTKWLPTSAYTLVLGIPHLEIYYENSMEICIAIK